MDPMILLIISAVIAVIVFIPFCAGPHAIKRKDEEVRVIAEKAGTVTVGKLEKYIASESRHERHPHLHSDSYYLATYLYTVDGTDYRFRIRVTEFPPEQIRLYYVPGKPKAVIADGERVYGAKLVISRILPIVLFGMIYSVLLYFLT